MPGAPAQVLPVDGFVLATIRDPGLLLVLKEEPDNKLKEEGRIQLAADAWGVALTKDEKVAVVTSAWTHTVTGIDWRARKVLWTLNVAREPRGVVIHPNGKTAYVSHLTSADLTRIDDVASEGAKASRVAFPAAPMRTPVASPLDASLGYSLVIDDAGNRLLAARHALGALAADTWFGVSTIDVLQTQNDKPLLAPRVPDKRIRSTPAFDETRQLTLEHSANEPDGYRQRQWRPQLQRNDLVQPRAMIVAHKSQTVWVAYEGHDAVAEYPLLAAAPGETALRLAVTGRNYRDPKVVDPNGDYSGIPSDGASPTGLALSSDETLLYVFCRTTYDVVTLRVGRTSAEKGYERLKSVGEMKTARVAAEPVDDTVSRGRKLFYGGRDTYSSGGMGCAGCHPEGRDDGHVWHEVFPEPGKDDANFLATKNLAFKTKEGKLGYPRQTPMLAGRMSSSGPFGWHAQNATLSARLAEGFLRHRWGIGWDIDPKSWMTNERAVPLAAFLRRGLVPPPRAVTELTDEQKKGKEIFESAATKCVQCHTPATEFTTRLPYPLKKVDPPAGFEDEENNNFKAPSLLFVGGTGPYYHDGSMATLQDLIAKNGDRMGTTSHLSASERAALVAYLETL
jgi:DNA-binding beta-propeller fold protein YncE/mono/diheme cytochrome c family protein